VTAKIMSENTQFAVAQGGVGVGVDAGQKDELVGHGVDCSVMGAVQSWSATRLTLPPRPLPGVMRLLEMSASLVAR